MFLNSMAKNINFFVERKGKLNLHSLYVTRACYIIIKNQLVSMNIDLKV